MAKFAKTSEKKVFAKKEERDPDLVLFAKASISDARHIVRTNDLKYTLRHLHQLRMALQVFDKLVGKKTNRVISKTENRKLDLVYHQAHIDVLKLVI